MVPGQGIVSDPLRATSHVPRLSPRPADKPYTVHRLLLGTHTSGQAQDHLQIATVHLPKRDAHLDRNDERGEMGGHTIPSTPKIQIIQKIIHPGEINKARYMPQNPDLIATKCTSGEILIYDRTKHSSEPERNGQAKPDIRLVGQQKEGYVNPAHLIDAY
jgi:histone-binding protein RBBP4